MMRRIILIVFLAVMCLGVGLVLSYGIEDSTPKPVPPQSPEVWKDPQSGLTWQVSPTGGRMKWSASKAHCASLSLGGHSDWRLPTINELRSLIRGCQATQKGGSCGVTDSCLNISCWKDPCKGCSDKGGPGQGGAYWPPELSGILYWWYWSSSPIADYASAAWIVGFRGGLVKNYDFADDKLAVRCVR